MLFSLIHLPSIRTSIFFTYREWMATQRMSCGGHCVFVPGANRDAPAAAAHPFLLVGDQNIDTLAFTYHFRKPGCCEGDRLVCGWPKGFALGDSRGAVSQPYRTHGSRRKWVCPLRGRSVVTAFRRMLSHIPARDRPFRANSPTLHRWPWGRDHLRLCRAFLDTSL